MVKKKNIDAFYEYAFAQVEKVKADLNAEFVQLQKDHKAATEADAPIDGPEAHAEQLKQMEYNLDTLNAQIRQANAHKQFLEYTKKNFILRGKDYIYMLDTDKPADFQERCMNILRTVQVMDSIKLYKRRPQPAQPAPIQSTEDEKRPN